MTDQKAFAKLSKLKDHQLVDLYRKVSDKNRALSDDGPVAATTWAILENHPDDAALYEELCYHMFAAGFSRKVVREKWPAHREAFSGFDPSGLAETDPQIIETLVTDRSLIRNRRKLSAVLDNARTIMQIKGEFGSFRQWLGSFSADRIYLLHRELVDRFTCVGRSAAEWFLLSSGFPYYFQTADAVRMIKRLGLMSTQNPKQNKDEAFNSVVMSFQAASGVTAWQISIDFWRFASGFRMREAICAEAPNCAKCPLWDYCDFFNQNG